MPHPLVLQLRFARSEFQRALVGLTDDDARRRVMPMNCISWNVGHLAWQEQRYWLTRLQGVTPIPGLNERVGYGCPASTPSLEEMQSAWRAIAEAADPVLDALTTARLAERIVVDGRPAPYTAGSMLQRTIYHYWFHTGENIAIRQVLGHTGLPDFVGNIDDEAPYTPE